VGTHRIIFCADYPPDPDGIVTESNENNNCGQIFFTPETAPPPVQCRDGIDNDGDGFADFSGSPTAIPPGVGNPGCLNANDDERNNPTFEEVTP